MKITFLNNFIDFLKGLVNSLQKKWNSLSPSVKKAFTIASQIVDELVKVTNSEQASALINLLLSQIGQKGYSAIRAFLPQIQTVLGISSTIIESNTVEQNLLLISQYLKEKQGIAWASNADQLYKILATALSDSEISFAEAQLIGKWVYDNVIVKNK